MKKMKQLGIMAAIAVGVMTGLAAGQTVLAVDLDPCTLDPASALCTDKETNVDNVFKTLVNILLFVVGALAVIVIIISGIRYTTAGGNASNVSAAKNTLLYAIVGLVVAICAWVIVNFVVEKL